MYARAECLRRELPLVCRRAQNKRFSGNGARMGLMQMPSAHLSRVAHLEYIERSVREQVA